MRNIEAGGLGRAPNASQNGVPWSEGRIPFQRIVSCLRQIASNIYLTKFTPQNASAKHYSTGERVHAARGLLGSDQQFVSWKGRWWKRRTNGEKIRGFSRSLRFPPRFSFLFFFFFLFSPPFPYSMSSKLLQSKKRLVAVRNDDGRSRIETSFSRVKIKFPCLCSTGIERSGDHRFSAVEKFESQWGKLAFFTR